MDISLSISAAPSITDKIAVVIYLASAPTVIVDSQEFNPPHLTPRNITFTDVNPETHIVNTYETVGLPTLGTLRHSFIYQPTLVGADIKRTDFLYMIGGATDYTDTSWIGYEVESIERVGLGTQYEEDSDDLSIEKTITLHPAGDGFSLAQDGDSFGNLEKWVARFYPKIVTTLPIYRSAKVIRDFRIIDSNTTLTDADAGLALMLKGASSHFTVTVPEIITLENALGYYFISDGGIHVGVTIQRTGTTDLFDLRGNKTYIELVQGDRMWMSNYNATNKWIISKEPESWFRTGQIIDKYDKPANAYDAAYVFADGTELDRTIYKRLFDYYNSLPASAKVSKATWDSNINQQGKWHNGDGSTTFGTPRLYSAGFLRGVDGSSRLPGSYHADEVGPHDHDGVPEPGTDTDRGRDSSLFSADSEGKTAQTGTGIGTETQPKNYGIYKLIHI